MGGGGEHGTHTCGVAELVIFILAIASGTACSICSKMLMDQTGVGITGEVEPFEKPLFQTFGMFLGMIVALPIHCAIVAFKIPFPGYDFKPIAPKGGENSSLLPSTRESVGGYVGTPVWMLFFLAIPSVFDLGATALCMMGLRYINVSIYQMLRGSGIIFVALLKQNMLKHKLHKFQWVGVFWNLVSVILVGMTAVLASVNTSHGGDQIDGTNASADSGKVLTGIVFVMAGAFVQALQFVFEEKVMTGMEDAEAAVPPLLLISMEGLWGGFFCLFILYPIAYYMPGDDHGSYEDPFNTWHMLSNSSAIKAVFVVYFVTILLYNVFACLVTFMLNSVWHAILDNFRPITVWGVDLAIYYFFTNGALGEPWTNWSFVQLVGMFVLLYGTSIYNAPNAGSLFLKGQWYSIGIDLSDEYRMIQAQIDEEEWEEKFEHMRQNMKIRTMSSPKTSLHTMALRGGLGSPKI
jgi:hypothetical protein